MVADRRKAVWKDHIEKGIWSRTELAEMYKVSIPTISNDLAAMADMVRMETKDQAVEMVDKVSRMHLHNYRLADEEYTKSQEDGIQETKTESEIECRKCRGKGEIDNGDCDLCGGKGTIRTTQTAIKRTHQCGDPKYLSEKRESLKELGRIRGLYPTKPSRTEERIAGTQQHLHIHQHSGADLSGVEDRELLEAISALDALRRKSHTEAIEVQPAPPLPDLPSDTE